MISDCAIGSATQNIDIVLLGGDQISAISDVSNKIRSRSAVICAKYSSPEVKVVVLSGADKIVSPSIDPKYVEQHASSELSSA